MKLGRKSKPPPPVNFEEVAEQMMARKGVRFLHCSQCQCIFVAIFDPKTRQLVGVGCPECKYAWPLGSDPTGK
jgi:hypothetical protein